MTRHTLLTLITLCSSFYCFSQENKLNFVWGEPFLTNINTEEKGNYALFLENGFNNPDNDYLPTLSHNFSTGSSTSAVKIIINSFTSIPLSEIEKKVNLKTDLISSEPEVISKIVTIKGKKFVSLEITGVIKINNEIKKITALNYSYNLTSNSTKKTAKVTNGSLSPVNFQEGSWHKYGITTTGAYKITYEELLDKNIISGPISSSSINLYGSKGEMNPFLLNVSKPNNLSPLNIEVIDNNDGNFNAGDYLLFYAEGPSNQFYESTSNKLLFNNNYYADTNYIFINTADKNPKRISKKSNNSTPVATIYNSDILYHHEKDYLNFIKSGRIWVGEDFQSTNPISFSVPTKHFKTESIWLKVRACARSFESYQNKISVIVNGDTVNQIQFPIVSTIYHNDYVKFNEVELNLNTNSDITEIKFYYHQQEQTSLAWLDYFSLNFQRENELKDEALLIYNKSTALNPDNYSFNFSSEKTEVKVWDITNYQEVTEINLKQSATDYSFVANTNSEKQFLAFSTNDIKTPIYVSDINPHLLNSTITPEYLIVSPPVFIQQANRLADHHRTYSGLKTLVVNTEHIYNTYSSGRKEAQAIRNYIKYFYDNPQGNDSLKYVLLFGSGSYDPKNRIPGNLDLVPTYQSENSIKLTASYVTDDFFGVLDDNEGDFKNNDQLDVSVGRLPVRTITEATVAVDKIFQYMGIFTQTKDNGETYSNKGPWRNNILFVADDGDINEHMKQAENIAAMVDTAIPNLNIDKVFIDAFLKETSASGTTANSAKENIIRNIEEGALIVNYTGHGGEYGWASERILDVNSILKLNNRETMPLVMTATCEFSRFDDPQRVSAGEYLFLQKNGGAIALFTTVRLVFSIPNFNLNRQLYNVIKETKNDETIRIGDLFRKTKLKNNAGTNDRNFTLLGDPALPLALPKNLAKIDSIVAWNKSKTDTLRALTQANVYGKITNGTSVASDFNGEVEIKIFDKKVTNTTLNNASTSNAFKYVSQNAVLYRGIATVNNGLFNTEIILPKNTLSNYGEAKISLYAKNSNTDGSGNDKSYTIGGLDSLAPRDVNGPEIKVYLNDSSFSFGDRVTPNPYFIAELNDESGINITSNNIQNNLVLTVNQSPEYVYILNSKYRTTANTYKSGNVSVQLNDLKNGNHSLEFTASDNYNNKNTHYTEFIIQENANLALDHVLNYPNPFTTNTGFYFEQNQLNANLEVLIQVYTITGKIIKTIITNFDANQKRIGPINWDGKDDYGDAIGRGVYIYKIKVIADNGTSAEQIEKLVILK